MSRNGGLLYDSTTAVFLWAMLGLHTEVSDEGWIWVLYFDAPISGGHTAFVPCWMPFLFVVFPTAILWYLDHRRIPPGHCKKCGYDLTGNTSGRCPECGTGT